MERLLPGPARWVCEACGILQRRKGLRAAQDGDSHPGSAARRAVTEIDDLLRGVCAGCARGVRGVCAGCARGVSAASSRVGHARGACECACACCVASRVFGASLYTAAYICEPQELLHGVEKSNVGAHEDASRLVHPAVFRVAFHPLANEKMRATQDVID
eukprot:6892686-Prymnesium_polylepis.1